jgi:hypothetical protein
MPCTKKDVGSDHVTNPRQGATNMTYYHAVACSVILFVLNILAVFGYRTLLNIFYQAGNLKE